MLQSPVLPLQTVGALAGPLSSGTGGCWDTWRGATGNSRGAKTRAGLASRVATPDGNGQAVLNGGWAGKRKRGGLATARRDGRRRAGVASPRVIGTSAARPWRHSSFAEEWAVRLRRLRHTAPMDCMNKM